MRRLVFTVGALAFVPVAVAQPVPSKPILSSNDQATTRMLPSSILGTAKDLPPKPPTDTPGPIRKFDTAALTIKGERGQWQLWSGGTLLKDFGPNEADARETLRLFRELKVDSQGSIGGVFEYWLSDGDAPTGITRQRHVIGFDAPTLRVEQTNGTWVLRDAKMILYNFGRSQSDAQEALDVCRKYGFNELGVVGTPTPTVKYLLRTGTRQLPDTLPASAKGNLVDPPVSPLTLPGYGPVGDRETFDYRKLEVRREANEWAVVIGKKTLGRFGISERAAKATAMTLTEFRCTEICRIGSASFFLSHGRAPQGTTVGGSVRSIHPESLVVRPVNGVWSVAEGSKVLAEVGSRQDADRMLAAIHEYKFDALYAVGGGRLGNLNLFIKSR
ncbi:MAG: hypothetical protein U0746_01700 [Gemmataceae bacterium]